MATKIVTENQLGKSIYYDATADKLAVRVDGTSVKVDATTGELSSPAATVVSGDAGNIIYEGSDDGALLKKDDIKTIVGEMVASSTDGIDYDAINKTLQAYLYSMAGDETSTAKVTVTEDGDGDGTSGDAKIKVDVKLSQDADNDLTTKNDGLFFDLEDATTNVHTIDTTTGAEKFKTKVNNVEDSSDLVELQGLDGSHLAYAFV